MKKIVLVIFVVALYGCTNSKKVNVDSRDADKHVEIICSKIDSITEHNFRKEFKRVLKISTVPKGKAVIVDRYSKQYKYLTLGDILKSVNTLKAKKNN